MRNQPASELAHRDQSAGNSHLRELAELSRIGELYLRALMRQQLRLSMLVTIALFLGLGAQPLVDWFWPEFASLRVLDIPLTWILLGALSYPFLVLCGYYYVVRSEAIDEEFGDLVR